MIVYPAIDLIDGQCVRLLRGDFTQQTRYHHDPLSLALHYQQQGAQWLHLVDLNAAANPEKRQRECLARVAEGCSLRLQVGGGIRTLNEAQQLLQLGFSRVVIGSLVVRRPQLALELLENLGAERVVFAFDVHPRDENYYLCSAGWREQSTCELFSTLTRWVERGLRHLLCTDICRDGTLEGPNVALYRHLHHSFPQLSVQASGGVACLHDLTILEQVGLAGAITGKALLEGRFTLKDALAREER